MSAWGLRREVDHEEDLQGEKKKTVDGQHFVCPCMGTFLKIGGP